MSNVIYLRPPAQAREQAKPQLALRIALTRTQMAAIIQRGSAPRGGVLSLPVANVFMPVEVIAGKPRFAPVVHSKRLESEFIAVPDDILLARQARARAVAFSINGWPRLSDLVSGLIHGHKTMVETWTHHGSQPSIYLKYRANHPFGRIVHVGSSEATDLRAVAASFSMWARGTEPLLLLEISLASRN